MRKYTEFDFKTAEKRLRNGNENIRRQIWPEYYSIRLFKNELKKEEEILMYNRALDGYCAILTDEDKKAKDWVDPAA